MNLPHDMHERLKVCTECRATITPRETVAIHLRVTIAICRCPGCNADAIRLWSLNR